MRNTDLTLAAVVGQVQRERTGSSLRTLRLGGSWEESSESRTSTVFRDRSTRYACSAFESTGNQLHEKLLAMVTTRHITADELYDLGEDAPYVLIEGELVEVMSPQGRLHGKVLSKLNSILDTEVVGPEMGELLVGDVGFVLARDPDTVLAPDLAFVRAERLTNAGDAYLDFAPDLAIEVVSPSNKLAEIARKTELYLRYGSSEVWVVHSRQRDAR